ncbi:MAG: hypothetical protein Q9171_001913 [Xanthocarpia ochracea]
MDAAAYLKNQGWRGSGHTLQPNGQGISKPLLVSRKTNVLGVGKKAHDAHGDQWWSRAFEETLRSLNGQTSTKRTTTSGEADAKSLGVLPTRWTTNGGLHGSFVRGESLKGTMGTEQDNTGTQSDIEKPVKKRRLHNLEESRRERDKKPSRNSCKKRNSHQPSSSANLEDSNAYAAAVETPTIVSSLSNGASDHDTLSQGAIKNNKIKLLRSTIDPASLSDSMADPVVATSSGHSTGTPIFSNANEIKPAGQGPAYERRSKKKEQRLNEQGSSKGAAANGGETGKLSDQRIEKQKRRKRRKDEGPRDSALQMHTGVWPVT